MKKIKFRGIDYYEKENKDKSVFIYGSLIVGNNNNYILTESDKESMVISITNHAALSVHRIIKGSENQYTGIKDKNKKEIYFSDYGKLNVCFERETDWGEYSEERDYYGVVCGTFARGIKLQYHKYYDYQELKWVNQSGIKDLAGYRFQLCDKDD